jgi:hypothetical protein
MLARKYLVAPLFILLSFLGLLPLAAQQRPLSDAVILRDFLGEQFKITKLRNFLGIRLDGGAEGFERLDKARFADAFDGIAERIPGPKLRLFDESPHYQKDFAFIDIEKTDLRKEFLAGLFGDGFDAWLGTGRGGGLVQALFLPQTDLYQAFYAMGGSPRFAHPPKLTNYAMAKDGKSFTIEVELPQGWDFSFYRYQVTATPLRVYRNNTWSAEAYQAARQLVEDDDFRLSGSVFGLTYSKAGDTWKLVSSVRAARTLSQSRPQFSPPVYDEAIAKAVAKAAAVSSSSPQDVGLAAGPAPAIPSSAKSAEVVFRDTGAKVPVKVASTEVIAADSGGSYEARNLFDGDDATVWGPKAWKGGKFTVYFGEPRTITSLAIANGYRKVSAKGRDLFAANARVKILGIMNDRGEGCSIELMDERTGRREYNLTDPGVGEKVWSLSFEIGDIYPGSTWQDVLMGELEF